MSAEWRCRTCHVGWSYFPGRVEVCWSCGKQGESGSVKYLRGANRHAQEVVHEGLNWIAGERPR